MKTLSFAFAAALALSGCAAHGHHASASAAHDCCANKKAEAMKDGAACDHDKTKGEAHEGCEHETTAAAAAASPTPAAK